MKWEIWKSSLTGGPLSVTHTVVEGPPRYTCSIVWDNCFILCSLEQTDLPESDVCSYFCNGFMRSKYWVPNFLWVTEKAQREPRRDGLSETRRLVAKEMDLISSRWLAPPQNLSLINGTLTSSCGVSFMISVPCNQPVEFSHTTSHGLVMRERPAEENNFLQLGMHPSGQQELELLLAPASWRWLPPHHKLKDWKRNSWLLRISSKWVWHMNFDSAVLRWPQCSLYPDRILCLSKVRVTQVTHSNSRPLLLGSSRHNWSS